MTSGICRGNPSRVKERQIIYISIPHYTLTNTFFVLLFARTYARTRMKKLPKEKKKVMWA